MFNRRRNIACSKALLIFLAALCACQATWARDAEQIPRLVVMAAISDDPQRHISAMKPLAEYMTTMLAPLGVQNVDIQIAESHEQMVRFLRDGRVDWVTETAYSAAMLEKHADAEILLRKWKHGVPVYKSVIFVRKDSGIDSLRDLQGGSIAFQHPGSTTGFFVPRAAMLAEGLALRPMRSVRERPTSDSVSYIFSNAEYNTAMWVHKGLIDAGVLSDLDWEQKDLIPENARNDMKIVYTSPPIPRAVELVRASLNHRVKTAIKEILLAAHDDPKARDALLAYQMTTRFDELDRESRIALRNIRDAVSAAPAEMPGAP